MGWQRRSSGHTCNIMSGHAFAIGQYTGKIIDCVVYSTACEQCELNNKKKENIVGDSDAFWSSSTSRNNIKNVPLIDPLEHEQIFTQEEMFSNILKNTSHDDCPCTYGGSSGAMESNGILFLMKRIYVVMGGGRYIMSTLLVMTTTT